MTDESGSVSFTTKEMLVRIDGKLDAVAARQQGLDIEVALLKARTEVLERERKTDKGDDDNWHEEVRLRITQVEAEQVATQRRLAYAAGGIAVLAVLLNFLAPVILNFFGLH